MPSSAIFNFLPSSSFSLSALSFSRTHLVQTLNFYKLLIAKASTSVDYSSSSISGSSSKNNNWICKYKDNSVNIYYEEHDKGSDEHCNNILMLPTISDVSTVEEWRSVAKDIAGRHGKVNYRTTIVDWPGLGYSDRPKLYYNADVMEKFLVDFINAPDGPVNNAGNLEESSSLCDLFCLNYTCIVTQLQIASCPYLFVLSIGTFRNI